MLQIKLREDVLCALGDLPGRPDESCDISPSLLLADLVIAPVPLDSIEEPAKIQLVALEHNPPLLLLAEVILQEPAILEIEGLRVAGGRAGLEVVDVLGLGEEGEGVAVEGEGGVPGLGGHDAADAEGLGLGTDLADELQGVLELLLGGVEHGGLGEARGGGRGGDAVAVP